MDRDKRRKLRELIRSVLPANPASKVVETFFGKDIARDMPMANSVRELAEWIIDRLLKDPDQLRATLQRLDDGSADLKELLSWADELEAADVASADDEDEGAEQGPPLTSRERFERRLRLVETGATVFGAVGPTAAILFVFNRSESEDMSPMTTASSEPPPTVEVFPRETVSLPSVRSARGDSEAGLLESPEIESLVFFDFQTRDGEELISQRILLEPDQIARIETWISNTAERGSSKPLEIHGFSGFPLHLSAPLSADSAQFLEPVTLRYTGPNLILSKELPILVEAEVQTTEVMPTDPDPPDHGNGNEPAALDLSMTGTSVLLAISLLGALAFRKASRRLYSSWSKVD